MNCSFAKRQTVSKEFTIAIIAALAWSAASHAGIIISYNPSDPNSHLTYDRFSSGYPSTTANPTIPVANTSPLFIGNGFSNDLSGVGWKDGNTAFSVTMVSERQFIGAAHVGYEPGSKINFVNSSGQVFTATVQTTRVPTTNFTDANGVAHTVSSDVVLGTLTAPIPASAQIAFYSIVQAPVTIAPLGYDSNSGQSYAVASPPNFYDGKPLLNYGQNSSYASSTHLGANNSAGIGVFSFGNYSGEATVGMAYAYNPYVAGSFYLIGGDSGGPSFMPYNGQLTLLGGHYGITSSNPELGDFSVDSFLPFYTDQLNAFMALDTDETHPSGYALSQISAVPEPGPLHLLVFAATLLSIGHFLRRFRRTSIASTIAC